MYKPNRKFLKRKEVEVIIETTRHKISGKAFIIGDRDFLDLLNTKAAFLILTHAKVFPLNDEQALYERNFLAINKNFIVAAWESR